MKIQILSSVAALLVSFVAQASTPPEAVDRLDRDREGALQSLVLAEYEKSYAAACEFKVSKTEIVKIVSGSANDEKQIGTPYTYDALYLVVQKCLSGSTFAGAYSDVEKSVILKGSFRAKYKSGTNQPKKLEDVKIELVKEVPELKVNL